MSAAAAKSLFLSLSVAFSHQEHRRGMREGEQAKREQKAWECKRQICTTALRLGNMKRAFLAQKLFDLI